MNIINANCLRTSNTNRWSMSKWKFTSHKYFLGNHDSRNRLHGHNHISMIFPCRLTWNIRIVHGDIDTILIASQWYTRLSQCLIRRKGTSNKKSHRVTWPIINHIMSGENMFSISVNSIKWKIRSQISSSGSSSSSGSISSTTNTTKTITDTQTWLKGSNIKHFNQWTSLLISLTKEKKIKGIRLTKYNKITLNVSRTASIG
mmetsp:Transcript_11256/g.21057  ORF Transcript_11256/g.21057 Transcript_11256/m.21057 type:complete len:202 (-) Transcript_11256:501-1106(-)